MRVHFLSKFVDADVAILEKYIDFPLKLTTGAELPDSRDFEILVSGRPEREHLQASPRLKAVIIPFAGLPKMTQELMAEFPEITVHNLHHNSAATAETALMLLFAAAKRIIPRDRDFRKEGWPDRQWDDRSAILLEEKTALILGYGAIGRHIAKVLQAIGMTVMATRRSLKSSITENGVQIFPAKEMASLLPKANVLIVTLPETPETTGLIGEKELSVMPENSLLVNVGRGPIINEEALYNALKAGPLAAAGLDVWWQYPGLYSDDDAQWPSKFPFWKLDNVVMSPHKGGLCDVDMERRMRELAMLLNAAANGDEIPNRVDVKRGY